MRHPRMGYGSPAPRSIQLSVLIRQFYRWHTDKLGPNTQKFADPVRRVKSDAGQHHDRVKAGTALTFTNVDDIPYAAPDIKQAKRDTGTLQRATRSNHRQRARYPLSDLYTTLLDERSSSAEGRRLHQRSGGRARCIPSSGAAASGGNFAYPWGTSNRALS